ncbi:hypothetical protein [Thalassococcus sp. S3]|uniref:hypothetical protein n=1 Tax=Thalassococcus sp. S3 TaxID=2017482 RepID=UPI001024288C|nr:hypothetical protein [Thalassococcus sp. S3]QBF33274.1 hypothetical protein CFI11_18890 [Thalassococcus sp. S3]
MADQTNTGSSSSNSALAFIVGGLVVALAVLAWVVFSGGMPSSDDADIRIEVPGIGAVEGQATSDS